MGIFNETIRSTSPEATAILAKELGALLGPGDVVLLQGQVGAGKTHFARSLIQSRQSKNGMAEEVPSPTYTLVQTYSDGMLEIWHADLYRLSEPSELFELGLDEAFQNAVCLIEWPERMRNLAPKKALTIGFKICASPSCRELSVSGDASAWEKVQQWLRGTTNV